jgi:hypothetical protein
MIDDRFSLAAALALLLPVEGDRGYGRRADGEAQSSKPAPEIRLDGLRLVQGGKSKARPVKRRAPSRKDP